MKTLRLTALLPVALFVACGGSSDFTEGDDDGGDSVALHDLPAEFAAAQCELVERCATVYYDILFSLEDCKTLLEEQIRQGGFDEIEQAVDDGRIVYDAKSAASCFDAMGELACSDVNQRPIEACESALMGSVESGGECDLDDECQAGLICDTNLACPGQCAPLRVAGDPCQADDECASGLVCSNVTRRCVQPGALGEPCGGATEPQCDGGLACIGDNVAEMQTGVCRPFDEIELAGANETCNLDEGILCESGLSCVLVEFAGALFECRIIPASGGSCGIGFPEHCPQGEYCPLTGAEILAGTIESRCAPLPQDATPCAERPVDFLPRCEAYARCETATGTCRALRDLGESCTADNVCYSSNCVNGGCAVERACE